jgi:lysophospholipase L1-like esterase
MRPTKYIQHINQFFIPFCLVLFIVQNSCSPTAKLKDLPSVRNYAADIARFDSLNDADDYPASSILFAGSSSIRLWTTIHEDIAPYPVIQRGFGGAKIEDLAYYLQRIVYPHSFRAIVFFAGTNNITGSSNEMPADSIIYWIKNINHQVRKKYPIVPIFWIAITPTNSRIKAIDKVKDMNIRVKALCESEKKLFFIDTEKSFLNSEDKPRAELFIGDQLHFNRDGYKLWASLIKQELDKRLTK